MNQKELENVSYYHNSVKAWVLSSLAKDALIAFFSIVSLFIQNGCRPTLVNRIGMSSSVLCVVVTVAIFEKNKKYVEQTINGENPSSIGFLDKINSALFIISVIFLLLSFLVV